MSGPLTLTDGLLRGDRWPTESPRPVAALATLIGLLLLFGGLYGGVMGTFGLTGAAFSGMDATVEAILGERVRWQVAYSATKVPLLLTLSFVISLPSFFVLNTLLGLRGDFVQAVRALVATQAGLSVILASLAPVTVLWYASSDNYQAAVLFNGVMFAVASLGAQWLLRRFYRPLIAKDPRHRWLLSIWVVLYSFVAIQMAWVLRPFVGYPGSPVQFFREEVWDNAYVIIAETIWQVLGQ